MFQLFVTSYNKGQTMAYAIVYGLK